MKTLKTGWGKHCFKFDGAHIEKLMEKLPETLLYVQKKQQLESKEVDLKGRGKNSVYVRGSCRCVCV